MAGCLPRDPSFHAIARTSACNHPQEGLLSFSHKWYFPGEEIDNHSPSRKDGISFKEEAHLRKLYCSYLQELGMEMKVPQKTIATAMMFCHRFYMRQSHTKNYWQTIAVASMFLASKAEETPCFLRDIVFMAYKLANKWDPLAPQRIRRREIYDKQKETLLLAERLLLATLAFELSIELPYKSLVAAVKKLGISHDEVIRVAWNYVNDWLRTTLCLQYKPHYIAAGSLCLAAKRLKLKLPSTKGNAWWMQFDVSPKQLEEVIQHMQRLEERCQKRVLPSTGSTVTESETKSQKAASLSSPESCISNGSVVAQDSNNRTRLDSEGASRLSECQPIKQSIDVHEGFKKAEGCRISDTGSPNSVVEDGDIGLKIRQSEQNLGSKMASFDPSYNNIDVHQIRERLKRRKLDRNADKKLDMETSVDIDSGAWIERELESGVEK